MLKIMMFLTSIDLNCLIRKSVRLIFNEIVKNPKFTRYVTHVECHGTLFQ